MLADLVVYLGGTLLLAGAIFTLLATIGVLRLPDLFTRMHAASKAGAVGGGLILLAVSILSLDVAVVIRAIIGIVFILLTTPVSAHLLARASYLAGFRACNDTMFDKITSDPDQNSAV